MTTATWSDVQAKARTPGSPILTQWRAEREAARSVASAQNSSNGRTEWIASSDPQVIELLGASRAAAGVSVTHETAKRVSAVYACVTRIAGGISQLPLHHYERVDGSRRPVVDSPYWWIFNESPHAGWTSASMWEIITQSFLLRESGFAYIRRNKMGQIKEVAPLPWESVTPEKEKSDDSYRLKYYVNDGMRTYGVDQDDMLHFPGFGFDGLRAMSVIQYAARNATGNAIAMDEYSGRFFAGGSHHSIVLEAPAKMTDSQITALQQAYSNKYSGLENAHRLPLVLTEGLKAKEVSINAQDAQLLEARKFQVVDIARAFGVPPHLIGETSAATSWGSGLEEMSRAFMLYTVQPHLRRIEQELNRKIFRTAKFYLEFDRDAMLDGNNKAQSEAFRAALGGPGTGPGWMSVDEVRRKKNLAPLGGESAQLYRPPEKDAQASTSDQTGNMEGTTA